MAQYKVIPVHFSKAEQQINMYAQEGWKVVTTSFVPPAPLPTGPQPVNDPMLLFIMEK